MSIKVNSTRRDSLGSLGASAKEQERQAKREQIETIAALSAEADSRIIDRAVGLANLLALGHASCSDVDEYNAIALDVWRVNIQVFQLMVGAGADRAKLKFPFQPPLFTVPGGVKVALECTQTGKLCGVSVDSPCSGGKFDARMFIDTEGNQEQVALFANLQPKGGGLQGLGTLGLAPLVTAALWAVGFLFTSASVAWLVISVLDSLPGNRLAESQQSYNKVIKQIGIEKTNARLACAQTGASPDECRRIVNESFATPAKPSGVLSGIVGTSVKIGAIFLGGTFLYRKMQER